MAKAGRRPWKAPDGVETQSPTQTTKANAAPRPKKPRSVYEYERMKRKTTYGKVRRGYGRYGHLE